MRRFGLVLLIVLSVCVHGNTANAATYGSISGQITSAQGLPFTAPSFVLLKVNGSESTRNLDDMGRYSLDVPVNTPFELTVVLIESGSVDDLSFSTNPIRTNPGFSNWSTSVPGINGDQKINLQIPDAFKVDLRTTDAQNNNLVNIGVTLIESNQEHDNYSFGGLVWSGIQSPSISRNPIFSSTGRFTLYIHSTSSFKGFRYWQFKDLTDRSAISGYSETPAFPVKNELSIQLCFPINFGATKSTPASCIDNVLEQKAAAEKAAAEKAAAEKAAAEKAAAEKAAAEKAAAEKAASKKITITCIKGKLKKRITSTSSKCPPGFKKK
jgi:hypothetical protein